MFNRIMVGALLLLGSLFLIWWGVLPVTFECLLIGCLGYYEFTELAMKKAGRRPSLVMGLIVIAFLVLSSGFLPAIFSLPLLFLGIFTILVHFVFHKDKHPNTLFDAAATVFGVIYLGCFISFVVFFRQVPGKVLVGSYALDRGAALLAFLILINAGTDIGSFFIGKFFGRLRLCPNISPGKTVEGALGGLLLAVLVGYLLGNWLGFKVWQSTVMALIIALSAQLGDLWESALKREAGVKDSGNFLWSHGGILDRFDSLLFSAPLAYLFWQYFIGL